MFNKVKEIVNKIKNENPLILNITNNVSIDFVANGLLSLGASPIMSFAMQEIEDLIKLSNAIVINIGTLSDPFIGLCQHACFVANKLVKPIIFDPVGAGASAYRTKTCKIFLKNYQLAIIRGNASEIAALAGAALLTKGVDSTTKPIKVVEYAEMLSAQYAATICMSGATDIIIAQKNKNQYDRGSPFMPMITGTGCLLSAVVAAFHAVEKNSFIATSAASLFFSVCGEIAAKQSIGPGSFKVNFLDALNLLPIQDHYEQ